jgi:hypothetical protein
MFSYATSSNEFTHCTDAEWDSRFVREEAPGDRLLRIPVNDASALRIATTYQKIKPRCERGFANLRGSAEKA